MKAGRTRTRLACFRALVLVAVLAWSATPGVAQVASEPIGRLQFGAGVGWLGGARLGGQTAELRTSSVPFRLFETDTRLRAAGAFEARLGVGLSERFGIEARFALSKPDLRTTISGDAEAAGVTLAEQVDQYVIDGGIVVRLREWMFLRMIPFASAGGGYVRQLHEGLALVEEGRLFYAGGGVARTLFSRSQGFVRAASLRGDVRFNLFSDEFDDGGRPQASISAGIVVTF